MNSEQLNELAEQKALMEDRARRLLSGTEFNYKESISHTHLEGAAILLYLIAKELGEPPEPALKFYTQRYERLVKLTENPDES